MAESQSKAQRKQAHIAAVGEVFGTSEQILRAWVKAQPPVLEAFVATGRRPDLHADVQQIVDLIRDLEGRL